MVTGGSDSKVKIFDLRMYKEIHAYNTYGGPPTALDISQTGVLGIGHGCHTTFWKPEALKVKMSQDKKQRREAEVRSLLEKLSPDMISLDPDTVGGVEGGSLIQRSQRSNDAAEDAKARREAEREEAENVREKKRMRGRSKIAKKLRRKQKNVVDENVMKLRELREREKVEKEERRKVGGGGSSGGDSGDGDAVEAAPAALKRFF